MAKCDRHGLMAASDGRCVLCRRDEPPSGGGPVSATPMATSPRGWLVACAAVVLACGVAAWARSRALAADVRAAERTDVAAGNAEPRNVRVTLYGTAHCPYCQKARRFLTERGVAFEDKDVDSSPTDKATARALSGGSGVPVIQIDDEVVYGFNEQHLASSLQRAEQKRRSGG